jgi:hypothetical protein
MLPVRVAQRALATASRAARQAGGGPSVGERAREAYDITKVGTARGDARSRW